MKFLRYFLRPVACFLMIIIFSLGWQIQPVAAATITVTTVNDTVANNGVCSLREAIMNANNDSQSGSTDCLAGSGIDTINLPANTYTIDSELPAIQSDILFVGNDANTTIIQAATAPHVATYRIFRINSGTVEIEGITLRHGQCIDTCSISSSPGSESLGGAIYIVGGILTVQNSVITDNRSENGGGIAHEGAQVFIENSIITENVAVWHGGGIYNELGAVLTIINSSITDNVVENNNGGGINNAYSTVVIDSSIIDGNTAGTGGGIYSYGETAQLTIQNNSQISNNTSKGIAGGIVNSSGGAVNIENSLIFNNSALEGGGLVNVGSGDLSVPITVMTVIGSTISNNRATDTTATAVGGGVLNRGRRGDIMISNSFIVSNFAVAGGGGVANFTSSTANGNISIISTEISSNTSNGNGSAIYHNSGNFTVVDSCIVNNSPIAVQNDSSTVLTATANWWGAADGPGLVALGSGDTLSDKVDYGSFLTSPPIIGGVACPTLSVPPTVISTTPLDGAADVALDTDAVIYFSEPVSTVFATAICDNTQMPAIGTVGSTEIDSFTYPASWLPNATCTVAVSATTTDGRELDGNEDGTGGDDYIFSFTVAVTEITPEVTPEITPEVTPEITPEVTPEITPEVTPEITPEVTPEITPEITPEVTPETTPEVTPEVTPEIMPEITPEVTPEITPEVTDNPVVTEPTENVNNHEPQTALNISVFDPAISKIGLLQPGQVGVKGEQVEWIVTVSNTGTVAGLNIVVSDTLIPALQIDNVDAPGAVVSITGQTVTVTYALINPGESVQFSIFTTVLEGVEVNNTACVKATNPVDSECATASAITSLPSTGESPWWRHLMWLGAFVSLGSLYMLRRRMSS